MPAWFDLFRRLLGWWNSAGATPARTATDWPVLHGPDSSFPNLSGPDHSFHALNGPNAAFREISGG